MIEILYWTFCKMFLQSLINKIFRFGHIVEQEHRLWDKLINWYKHKRETQGVTGILLNCVGSVFENFKSLQSHNFHLETFEQLCQSVNNSLIEISHFLKPTLLFATVNWRLLIIERTHWSLVYSAHLSYGF